MRTQPITHPTQVVCHWLLFFKPEVDWQMAAKNTLPLSWVLSQFVDEPRDPAATVLASFRNETALQFLLQFQVRCF